MSASNESPAVFAILSSLVEASTGLHYGLAEREMFFERVSARASEAGFDNLLDYYYYLRYDPGGVSEMRALTEALVVNETFFFREIDALRMIVNQFLEPAVRAGRRPRVWSAACATGEEPLTLAMLLAERGILGEVDIVATDISDRVLARARKGRFSPRAVRMNHDIALAGKWLRVQPGGEWTVAQELITAIQWRPLNLVDGAQIAQLTASGRFDVILCRNVLIYFSDDTVLQVLRSLADALQPVGTLCVGVSESLLRFGTFLSCEEHEGIFHYRKVA